MDITDFNNKGKKPINMTSPKPSNPQQPFSPQYTPKTPKSFNSQIYSPQPFSPNSYNSQIFSPQPFTPMSYNSQIYSSQSFSPFHPSRPNTPKRPKTPNQFPPRSSNNSPFEMPSSSNSNPTLYGGIHHSNSTSKLYIKNDQIPTAINTTPNNINSLYPPTYPYVGKFNNKKSAVHKVYQHTRKVVNDDNNEAVEVSEVTQQLFEVNGSDVQRGETSLYSFTTYTSNDNKKKIKHTHSNIEIHSYLSDSSSDGNENVIPSSINTKKNNIKNNQTQQKANNIQPIPSQGSLEENNDDDDDDDDDNVSPQKYNVPLNDTINRPYHRKFSSDHGKYNYEYYNNQRNVQNKKVNSPTKNNIPQKESTPLGHKKHYSDHGKYSYNGNNNFENKDNQINIVIRNPENNIISPSSNYSEESYREDYSSVGSPKSSYSVFSSTYQKTNSVKDDPYRNNSNITNEENVSNFSLHQNQASAINSLVYSQNNSYSEYDQDSEIVNPDDNPLYKVTNRNRKKHKTTTTTTTTYEIIEDIDDDEENENENENEENSENEEINQHTVEKYVRFTNFPYQYNRESEFRPRGLLTGPSDSEFITDKSTLSHHINLRKSSWHTSFFENRGRQPSSSMFSIPRYQPDRQTNTDKFENKSYDSLEDKACYHILYQFDKEDFIVRLGKALYLYGSPTFRTECTLRSVSKLLGLQGEFASFPTLILLSFANYNNNESLNSESHLLLTPTGYNLGKLEEVVQITYELKLALRSIKSKFNSSENISEMKQVDKKKSKSNKKNKKSKSKDNVNGDDTEDNTDSVVIEIERSNSIIDIEDVSKDKNDTKENKNNNINEENDITVYSLNDIHNSMEALSNNDKEEKENTNRIIEEPDDTYNNDDYDNNNNKLQDIDNSSDISIEKSEKEALTAAINKLDYVIGKPPSFGSVFWQLFSYVVAGATASPILFGGTWLDVIVSAFVGLIVGIITFYEPLYFTSHSHLVELLASLGASATLRIIQGIFPDYCVNFTADILSAVLYLLPGLNFTIGFIELASRNMISGTVRLMHSLVTSFMMGAGITIGVHITKFITVPIVLDTSATQTCQTVASPNQYWYILMFPLLGISLNMMFFANASQFPIMVFTTAISYVITVIGTKLNLPNEISIIIAALAVGIISNIYAKLRKKLAIIPIIIGVLLLVPGSVGVKGSLAFLIDQNFETGVQFTISMFTVSMWITIGVFLSNLIVFPFKNSEHMGLMTL